jgi:hypothetical protein
MDTSFFYFYDWDWDGTMTNDVFDADLNGMDDEDLSNLYAGLYTVTVTDVNGCTASATAQVDSFLSPMIITAPDTIALLCFGDLTTIDITVTGGFPTPPNFYDYAWDQDGIFNDPEDLVGVGAGTYIVAVTEPVSGCLSYDTIVVIEPPDLTISVSTTDAQCNDMPVGSYVITVSGGTPLYDYNDGTNSGMNLSGPTITVNNVTAGSYTVTVTDDNGCTATAAVIINAPPPIVIDIVSSGLACNGGPTGSVGIIVSGGVPPDTVINGPMDTSFFYFYDWDWDGTMTNDVFDADMNGMDDEDLNNLYAGIYTVTVTDNNGCTATASAQVDSFFSPLVIAAPDSIMLLCFGDLANINITVSGGFPTPPDFYNYDWDQNQPRKR